MTQEQKIAKIKEVLDTYGGVLIEELGEESPILHHGSKGGESMVEGLYPDYVSVSDYIHGMEVDTYHLKYDELKRGMINQVYELVLLYEAMEIEKDDKPVDGYTPEAIHDFINDFGKDEEEMGDPEMAINEGWVWLEKYGVWIQKNNMLWDEWTSNLADYLIDTK